MRPWTAGAHPQGRGEAAVGTGLNSQCVFGPVSLSCRPGHPLPTPQPSQPRQGGPEDFIMSSDYHQVQGGVKGTL